MRYGRLGKTDLVMSVLGMGCSQIASISTRHSPREVKATLEEAVDRGINFFDTADVYGQGDSERMLGRLLRERREDLYVCTKAGMTIGGSQKAIRLLKPLLAPVARRAAGFRKRALHTRRASEGRCWEPEQLKRRIEGSIRRLGVDRLDLFLLHSPSPTDLEDGRVYDLLDSLRERGLLRHHGVSVDAPADVLAFVRQRRASCLQVPLDVTTLPQIAPALEAARSSDMGIIAREVFGGGRLSMTSAGRGADGPCSPADLAEFALAPILKRSDIDVALVGATCRRHLAANLEVLKRLNGSGSPDRTPTC